MPIIKYNMTRRNFLILVSGTVASSSGKFSAAQTNATDNCTLRIASVPTAVEGGLLPGLLKSFQADNLDIKTTLTATTDPYGLVTKAEADMIISHFGHRDTESFVTRGLGHWPRTVFANQGALLGPPADPAGVRGLNSLTEAFRRIANTRSIYVVSGNHYLSDVLWHAVGKPPKADWFVYQNGNRGDGAMLASQLGGYVFWGVTPFLREQQTAHHALEPLVTNDPLLQRIMVSVIATASPNTEAATRFQDYLLAPATQAKMLNIHYPGMEQVVWAPAGRHNANGALPG